MRTARALPLQAVLSLRPTYDYRMQAPRGSLANGSPATRQCKAAKQTLDNWMLIEGRLTGQKPPLKLKEIWAIRVRLQLSSRVRDLAVFNLAIDSKLRACDLTKLRVRDVCHGEHIASRATIMQQKTQRPVQFEITEQTRDSVMAWIRHAGLHGTDFLFPSRIHDSPHLSTRQYARLVHRRIASIGLDDTAYGTHTMRRYVSFVAMSGNLNKLAPPLE
jgi:integrase